MGRTKGAKNLTAEERLARQREKESQPKRGRGRPKGSLGKKKIAAMETITVPMTAEYGENAQDSETMDLPVKKKIGRPKGIHKKLDHYTVSDKVLADRRERMSIMEPKTEEDINFNSRLIGHIMQINEIRSHADKSDLLSLKSCFIAYLKLCQANGFCVTNLSAYAAMGMDNQGFINFARKQDPEVQEFVRFVRETCAIFREGMVSANKLNPVIGIFWQRNYDGLRNDTEQIQNALEQEEDYNNGSKAYKERYRNLVEGK